MHYFWKCIFYLASFNLLLAAFAKVIYVDDNATAGGNGASWATAHKYLQDGLADAEYGDEIWVAEGTYKPDQGAGKTAGDRASPFVLVNGVGMYGGFLGTESIRDPQGDNNQTILSGEIDENSSLWSLNVVRGLSASAELSGFKITQGNANGFTNDLDRGSAIYLSDTTLTVSSTIIENNRAVNGGGIYVHGGSLELYNSIFSDNNATSGGGISCNESSLLIVNSYFSKNFAGNKGGAINSYRTSIHIKDSNFSENYTPGNGGAIYTQEISSKDSEIKNCYFQYNKADSNGGGIYISTNYTPYNFYENSFVNNIAGEYGGGIYHKCGHSNASTRGLLVKTEFIRNSAKSGGGICITYDSSQRQGSPYSFLWRLSHCLFWNNYATSNGGGVFARMPTIFAFAGTPSTSLIVDNCIIVGNSSDETGGGIYLTGASGNSDSRFTNTVIAKNSAVSNGAGVFSNQFFSVNNCILWGNLSGDVESHAFEVNQWLPFVEQEEVKANYPGDPNAKELIYQLNINIFQGWEEDLRAFASNPKFVDIDNPVGSDGVWFTEDDGLRLQASSPAIDTGYNNAVGSDAGDLDRDGNVEEQTPIDMAGFLRIQHAKVDIGPYEYGNSKIETHWIATSVSPENLGSVSGGNVSIEDDNDAIISASPSIGYLFSNWSGDASGSSNPLSIPMDSDKSITANFIQDLNDDDADGLTNFDELVTYRTDPSKQDTDGDGILDPKEIEIGSDPKRSESAVFNFGKSSVTSNPSAYNLVTKSAYDQMVDDMIKAQSANSTHYTEGWFYLPNRGWMWTNHSSYPYFYDAEDKDWMYFQSGEEKPRFYRYKTKTWLTIE